MDRQIQDQLDAQAGQEMVQRIQELNGGLPAICPSCGGNLSGLQHYATCRSGVPAGLGTAVQDRTFTPREQYIAEFKKLTDEMVALTTRKNADYAGESDPYANFREFGTLGFLVRMSDKWQRIKTLTESGKTASVKDETVEDTLLDLATYSLLLLTWLRSEAKFGR